MTQRRDFFKSLAAITAGIIMPYDAFSHSDEFGKLLPTRKLGKTGEDVTMLGVGGSHVGRSDERTAQQIIEKAIEGGIRFFDNAESYQSGRAERYYGKFLTPKYRDVSYIMTKSTARDAKTMKKHFESSLKNMKTDYVDLYQIHSISSPRDVDNRIENGILDFVLETKAKGQIRHVGFTGHASYKAHLRMLERTDQLETCQMPINMFDPNNKSFILNVLPKLNSRSMGVIAMKTLSNGGFFGGTSHFNSGPNPRIIPKFASIKEALHFVWSLPVSVIVTGAESAAMLQEKIDLAKSFHGMDEEKREELIARVAHFDGNLVEFYKT